MSGNGPVARDMVAQAGSLRTLITVGDRRVANIAAARADAVDAAPAGSIDRALREDLVPGSAVEEVLKRAHGSSVLSKRKQVETGGHNASGALDGTLRADANDENEKSVQDRLWVRQCKQRTQTLALPEPTLSWNADLNVKPHELSGVKKLFEVLLQIEVSHGRIPRKDVVPGPMYRAPPRRWLDIASAAVDSYRTFVSSQDYTGQFGSRGDVRIPVGASPSDSPSLSVAEGSSREDVLADPDAFACETLGGEQDDELRISFILQEAQAWKPVRCSYNSDLSMRMLSLKSEVSEGRFSQKRSQILRDGMCVEVHRYRRSRDKPLARKALAETQHIYERRVRDLLSEAFDLADMPNDELARQLASSISSKLVLDPVL